MKTPWLSIYLSIYLVLPTYLFIHSSSSKNSSYTEAESTKSLIFNGAASQSVSWWRHRQGFLVPFTQKSWNCCIYKCSAPGLWAINTALCCISAATSSKLPAFTCFSQFTRQICCTEVVSILSVPKNKMPLGCPSTDWCEKTAAQCCSVRWLHVADGYTVSPPGDTVYVCGIRINKWV